MLDRGQDTILRVPWSGAYVLSCATVYHGNSCTLLSYGFYHDRLKDLAILPHN